MNFKELKIPGSFEIILTPKCDSRGSFERLFCTEEFKKAGLIKDIAQINRSCNKHKGSFRGLHCQIPPFEEVKIIRCIKGSVYDILLDLRKNSPFFLKWISVELSDKNDHMVYIPGGVAHGFQTLEGNSELIYFHSKIYNPKYEMGIRYNDPDIQLTLPLEITEISQRDQNHTWINNNADDLFNFAL